MLTNLQDIVNEYLTFKTREGTYFNFRREGLHRFYDHENENVITEESYYVNGILRGESKSFYFSGALLSTCMRINNRISGVYKAYHENGQLEEICYYIDSMIEGVRKTYYDNGKIRSVSYYHSNKKHGEYKVFGMEGRLISLFTMVLGMIHGKCYEHGIWTEYKYDKVVK
jgi:antitoxin component YwqK of YwqJK toxin-antitoxin module